MAFFDADQVTALRASNAPTTPLTRVGYGHWQAEFIDPKHQKWFDQAYRGWRDSNWSIGFTFDFFLVHLELW